MSRRKKNHSQSIMNEPTVRELLEVMKRYSTPGGQDFEAMCQQIAGMEKQLNAAMEELEVMRRELARTKNSPVRQTLAQTVHSLEKLTMTLRTQMEDLKHRIVAGSQKALASFREQRVLVLANTAKFFRIRPALQAIEQGLNRAMVQNDKALARLEAASREYHEAGKHLKNMLKAIQAQEPLMEPKSSGAITRSLSASLQQENRFFHSMKERTGGAIRRLDQLEQSARPPVQQTIEAYTKLVQAQKQQEKAGRTVNRAER